LSALPIARYFSQYNEIFLTGGEPLLTPNKTILAIENIRHKTNAKLYLYTAKLDDTFAAMKILELLDGMTVTIHDKNDIRAFKRFDSVIPDYFNKSLRLNIFRDVPLFEVCNDWAIKSDIVYIDPCPLPENEVFKRYYKSW
jgi:hypothetical protein